MSATYSRDEVSELKQARTSKSIHDLPPLETGGVEARRGFSIQDHVGVQFCLELLSELRLKEVWFETQDDLTLIWDNNGHDEVEFIQVKGSEFNQLWSVAKLCERKGRDGEAIVGTSILERSLAYDRCSEPCCFRVVTARPVQDELSPLTHKLGSQGRISSQREIDKLIAVVGVRVGDFKSENGNGHDYWLRHAAWDEIHSQESVKSANLIKLAELVEAQGEYLFTDQREELYQRLLTRVNNAALARWHDDAEKKKLRKIDFRAWFTQQLANLIRPAVLGGGRLVQEKMARAQIPQDTIETAKEQRRRYREESLKPQYLLTRDLRLIDDEVTAALQDLRSQLDAGTITDLGVQFHARCLQRLTELCDQLPISPKPPLVFLHGCMYNIVDRCLHRFVRAES